MSASVEEQKNPKFFRIEIPRLGAHNFGDWSRDVKTILDGKGWMFYLTNPDPAQDEEGKDPADKAKNARKNDREIRSALVMTLDREHRAYVAAEEKKLPVGPNQAPLTSKNVYEWLLAKSRKEARVQETITWSKLATLKSLPRSLAQRRADDVDDEKDAFYAGRGRWMKNRGPAPRDKATDKEDVPKPFPYAESAT